MGLDISVYDYAKLVTEQHEREPEDGPACYEDAGAGGFVHHVLAYSDSPRFAQSLRGLEEGRCYQVWGHPEMTFRAGSYSGYNAFREALCQAALGVKPEVVWAHTNGYAGRPFYELINFSDCQGTIGPEACADLAADFAEQRELVRSRLAALPEEQGAEWFTIMYDRWAVAFGFAAGAGLVEFH